MKNRILLGQCEHEQTATQLDYWLRTNHPTVKIVVEIGPGLLRFRIYAWGLNDRVLMALEQTELVAYARGFIDAAERAALGKKR